MKPNPFPVLNGLIAIWGLAYCASCVFIVNYVIDTIVIAAIFFYFFAFIWVIDEWKKIIIQENNW